METAAQVYLPQSLTRPSLNGLLLAPGIPADQLAAATARAAAAAAPGAQVTLRPLSAVFARDVGEASFQGPIVAVLGVIALALTAIGLYGLVTYLVEQRFREFGIRLALGARPSDLWSSVLRQSVTPTVIGLAAGLAVSFWATRLLRSLLFGIEPNDWRVMAVVVALLGTAAVLAAIRPARRAMRVDPVSALRAD